jgi:hypothetical protein
MKTHNLKDFVQSVIFEVYNFHSIQFSSSLYSYVCDLNAKTSKILTKTETKMN